ncbi:hypothetical protein LCGC14_0196410 [marine sediment metagenome]|uniref:Uncharacterized protein n=1 Tax=marine sediment metagenome TaxID=412755 RepID=A0A0F9XNM4_9ZZZZ
MDTEKLEAIQELPDSHKIIFLEGVDPSKLTTTFNCQGCGTRCCTGPTIGPNVLYAPITFAYYRKKHGREKFEEIYRKFSHHIGQYSLLPLITTEEPFCPFLYLEWTGANKKVIMGNLKTLDLQLKKLMRTTIKKLDDAEQKEFTFRELWDLLSAEDEGETLLIFNLFVGPLIDNQVTKKHIKTMCGVYEAQPAQCRPFPFGRAWSVNMETNEREEFVKLVDDLQCPPTAFEGKEIGVDTFFKQQNVADYPAWTEKLTLLLNTNKELMEFAGEKSKDMIYFAIDQILYHRPVYNSDESAFNEALEKEIDILVGLFEELKATVALTNEFLAQKK